MYSRKQMQSGKNRQMNRASGSFRDPSGYVYIGDGEIVRTIHSEYQAHWPAVEPFLNKLSEKWLLVPFKETDPLEGSYKTLAVQKLPFISYPYEWSFSQLKAAALLTLQLQRLALADGLILKDASAFNIQYIGCKPVLIDHLSFEVLEPGRPWDAYRQFCSHFLAPLALASMTDLECGALSRLWIDGIPLPIAAKMLPFKAVCRFGLFLHLFLHARSQNKYADTGRYAKKAKQIRISRTSLDNIAASLERTVSSLQSPGGKTEWSDYYENTNYSAEAAGNKAALVEKFAQYGPKRDLALDLGANTGKYSELLARHYALALSVDMDPLAVERNFIALQKRNSPANNILPLVINLANPSPSLGFNCAERQSFSARIKADCVTGLALIHHLTITSGIPLSVQAEFFSDLLMDEGTLILEFIPKNDSQVQRLLAFRKDIFPDYTLEDCLKSFNRFECVKIEPIAGSERTLLLFKKTSESSPG